MLCLDPIAAAPVTLRELHIVEEDELVRCSDQVEVALPRNVAGLNYRDAFTAH